MPRIFSSRLMIYLFILLVLDLSLVPVLRIHAVQPILLYLIVLHAAFRWGMQKTVPMALMVGFLRDLTGSQIFGVEMASLMIASLVLDVVVQKISRESMITHVATSFFFVFGVSILTVILSGILGATAPMTLPTVLISLGAACYTAAVTPVFSYATTRWFHDRVPIKQYELFR